MSPVHPSVSMGKEHSAVPIFLGITTDVLLHTGSFQP